jgi:hypothetical protein
VRPALGGARHSRPPSHPAPSRPTPSPPANAPTTPGTAGGRHGSFRGRGGRRRGRRWRGHFAHRGAGGGDRSSGREAAAASSGDFGFSSLHPGVLAALLRVISEQLPCVFTAHGAIGRLTMEGLKIGMVTSNSVDQELNRTEELLAAQFYRNMYLYFSFAQSLKAQGAPRPALRGAAPRGAGVSRPAPPRPAPPRPAPPRPAPPRPAPPRPAPPRPAPPPGCRMGRVGRDAPPCPVPPCHRATRCPAPAVCDGPLLTPHSRNPPPFPPQPTTPSLGRTRLSPLLTAWPPPTTCTSPPRPTSSASSRPTLPTRWPTCGRGWHCWVAASSSSTTASSSQRWVPQPLRCACRLAAHPAATGPADVRPAAAAPPSTAMRSARVGRLGRLCAACPGRKRPRLRQPLSLGPSHIPPL